VTMDQGLASSLHVDLARTYPCVGEPSGVAILSGRAHATRFTCRTSGSGRLLAPHANLLQIWPISDRFEARIGVRPVEGVACAPGERIERGGGRHRPGLRPREWP
jgi:hypothetical protein